MAELIRLPDDRYLALADREIMDLQAKISDIYDPPPPVGPAFMEIACGAPRSIAEHPPAKVPVAMASFNNGQRDWEVLQDWNMLFTAVDLATFSVYKARAMDHDKRMRTPPLSASGPPPSELMASSTASGVEIFDVLRYLDLPADVVDVAVTLFVYDVVSNTVCIHFGDVAEDTETIPPVTVSSSLFLMPPSEAAGATRLAVPEDVVSYNAPVPVRGFIRVRSPLLPAVTPDGGPSLRAAVMLMQKDVRSPVVAEFDVQARVVGDQLEASFAFDMRVAAPDEDLEGKWQAYLIAGDQVVGPHALEVGTAPA